MSIVVPLIGLPGAGKTTVAEILESRHSFLIVSRDVVRDAMFPEVAYSVDEKQAAFAALCASVSILADRGRGIVVDGMTFSRKGELEDLFTAVSSHRFCPVYCDVSIEVAAERVESDRHLGVHVAEDRDAELVDRVSASFRTIPAGVARVSMEVPPDVVASRIGDLFRGPYEWRPQ